jgi:hypothetical protein
MDILGLKYLTRNAVRYLRGTARETRVLSSSVKIIKQNIKNEGDDAYDYSEQQYRSDIKRLHKNATISQYIFLTVMAACAGGVAYCVSIDSMSGAGACLAWTIVFGLYSLRTTRDIERMSNAIAQRE